MARKKKKKAPEGTPDWMVTYGDMMTLLLCFFVMIVAMSEIKQDQRFRKVVASMHKTFGYRGGLGSVPTDVQPMVTPDKREYANMNDNMQLHVGESQEESVAGKRSAVKIIREGRLYTVGTPVRFGHGRADLSPQARAQLRLTASLIRGFTMKVEVRGHTSTVPLPADGPYADHLELSQARARAVRDFLISSAEDRGRIDPRRIRVIGCGPYEPRRLRAYETFDQAINDRVEIIQTETLVKEFEGEPVGQRLLE